MSESLAQASLRAESRARVARRYDIGDAIRAFGQRFSSSASLTSDFMMDTRLHPSNCGQSRRNAPQARRARAMREVVESIATVPEVGITLTGGQRCGDRTPAGASTRSPDRHSIQRRVRMGPAPPPR
jgi:hypothetical protein